MKWLLVVEGRHPGIVRAVALAIAVVVGALLNGSPCEIGNRLCESLSSSQSQVLFNVPTSKD